MAGGLIGSEPWAIRDGPISTQGDPMDGRRSRFVPGASFESESLESRLVLSALPSTAAHVASMTARGMATKTTLAVSGGTLGQPINFTATVTAPASAGAPTGTVEFFDHNQAIGSLTLAPATSSNPKYAESQASATMMQTPGGPAYWFGKHAISAKFIPTGGFGASRGSTSFTIAQPTYTTITGGTKIATIVPGSGPAITSGQTANSLYTGYLAKNGKIFDESSQHGGLPLQYQLGAGQVVPGFDAGTVGMQVGETRIIEIPASQGYGSQATGGIPANSTLIFVVTLQSIS
jgi:hypothetical protein